ncbi:hypothetical protein OSB04_016407 [Centaurea solstitialis]|uniref:Uncharacterized protein n=1 Tax=Centaurea solstitialis TaxID=347529 RepID=A0AA38W9S3_9ASTR|nr:hypothetical protein OSB04_016407 [Centaurea solstitialis]
MSQWAISQTLASTAQLANLLPTGTLLALQTVSPIFTNHGSCDAATRPLTAILLGFLTACCFLASFTDSFKSPDGRIFYGFATLKGMWVFDSQQATEAGTLPDLRKYRLTVVDWIHAFVSAFVLVTVAMRDRNVVSCFYPRPSHEAQEVLDIVPLGLGLSNWPATCRALRNEKIFKGRMKNAKEIANLVQFFAFYWIKVSRMLVGGMKVVGIYIWVNESLFKNSTLVLCQTVKGVADAAPFREFDWDERLLIHISVSPRSWVSMLELESHGVLKKIPAFLPCGLCLEK